MRVEIQSIESSCRPPVITTHVLVDGSFNVWMMEDGGLQEGGLRATILRGADELAPYGAQLLLQVRVEDPGPGREDDRLRVISVNPALPVDQLLGELRSRLTTGGVVRSGSRLEIYRPDARRVPFTLVARGASDAARPEASVGTSGVGGKSQVMAHSAGALWLVPSAWSIIGDVEAWAYNQLRAVGNRLGLSARTIAWLIVVGTYVAISLWAVRSQYNAKQEAEDAQASAEASAAAAAASAQSALLAEVTCLAERADLVEALGDQSAQSRFQAELALAPSASRAVALEFGGARMGSEAVLERDDKAFDALLAAVVDALGKDGVVPDATRCLKFEQVLGYDLPAYALLWHPMPDVVCPADYAAVQDGVVYAGRWGLSTRAGQEFGQRMPETKEGGIVSRRLAEALSDPRMEDRWSAYTHATGLRAVTRKLLISRRTSRLPVLPSQAQAWGLALWSAANQLPSPTEGMMDQPIEECVEELLVSLAQGGGAAEPDTPLLPSLERVASGEVEVPVRATSGCPWPQGAIEQGAAEAMQAIVDYARVAQQNGQVD